MTVIREILSEALSELTIRSAAEGVVIYIVATAIVVFWLVAT